MTKPKITVHAFSNGTAMLSFEGDVRPQQIDAFRQMWNDAWEIAKAKHQKPVVMLGGADVEVVVHESPLGEDPFDFDAISHAFGSLGEYKEDEEIEAFIVALREYFR